MVNQLTREVRSYDGVCRVEATLYMWEQVSYGTLIHFGANPPPARKLKAVYVVVPPKRGSNARCRVDLVEVSGIDWPLNTREQAALVNTLNQVLEQKGIAARRFGPERVTWEEN